MMRLTPRDAGDRMFRWPGCFHSTDADRLASPHPYLGLVLKLWVQARLRLNLTSLIAVHTLLITVIDLRDGRLTKGAHDALTPDTSAYSRTSRRHIDPVVPRPIIDSCRRVPNCDRRPRTAGQEIVTLMAS